MVSSSTQAHGGKQELAIPEESGEDGDLHPLAKDRRGSGGDTETAGIVRSRTLLFGPWPGLAFA